MKGPSNHRRVLHFAVTGALLGGAVACTGNEPAKGDAKQGEAKQGEAKQPEPELKFAPNPGPDEHKEPPVKMVNPGVEDDGGAKAPLPEPTTAVVPEPPPVEPVGIGANEGPVKEPKPTPEPKVDKHVNEGPEKEPVERPPLKVNPGPEG
jgi:hypothetical protein